MSSATTAHDLFRYNLTAFKNRLLNLDDLARATTTPAQWQWFTSQYEDWLTSLSGMASRTATAHLIYTRANYVKFSQMIYDLETTLSHLMPALPQWSYLVTELHCRVLEREALAAANPDHEFVNANLKRLLCRMHQ